MDPAVESAIRSTAAKYGIEPGLMMAIAERESSFNPNASSGSPHSSAYGLFQLLRAERAKYGGSTNDPTEQAEAWANYITPVKDEMTRVLGREPTGPELYTGHYFGGTRAARMVSGAYHPDLPVGAVFSPKEMAANPNFGRAGTVGGLTSSVLHDMDRRIAKHSGGTWSGGEAVGSANQQKKGLYPGELVTADNVNADPVAEVQKLELPGMGRPAQRPPALGAAPAAAPQKVEMTPVQSYEMNSATPPVQPFGDAEPVATTQETPNGQASAPQAAPAPLG